MRPGHVKAFRPPKLDPLGEEGSPIRERRAGHCFTPPGAPTAAMGRSSRVLGKHGAAQARSQHLLRPRGVETDSERGPPVDQPEAAVTV
ncbi:hypothetical protein S7711_10467 [Stachybotrys chartarum IBT 7711]|uniref:Uncharacterized protein n=1 Tax=Stachybotrys chartarum (strain CBS 109288 / IBT 7711) TaxID=1280523 RepID=A0A084B758_STACB|nr:hypothetical protein S7711_10467 [Stachybotrys chartarum IBT 7711]KFA52685.1 hypothetical protein S40293_10938 [Stachybotrys chartarum IBT 40293]